MEATKQARLRYSVDTHCHAFNRMSFDVQAVIGAVASQTTTPVIAGQLSQIQAAYGSAAAKRV
jgi:hypothetical protein